jgi:hypothetical protein
MSEVLKGGVGMRKIVLAIGLVLLALLLIAVVPLWPAEAPSGHATLDLELELTRMATLPPAADPDRAWTQYEGLTEFLEVLEHARDLPPEDRVRLQIAASAFRGTRAKTYALIVHDLIRKDPRCFAEVGQALAALEATNIPPEEAGLGRKDLFPVFLALADVYRPDLPRVLEGDEDACKRFVGLLLQGVPAERLGLTESQKEALLAPLRRISPAPGAPVA